MMVRSGSTAGVWMEWMVMVRVVEFVPEYRGAVGFGTTLPCTIECTAKSSRSSIYHSDIYLCRLVVYMNVCRGLS